MNLCLPWRVPYVLTFLGAFLLAWPAALPAPAAAQQAFVEDELRELVEGLRNGTLRPSFVSRECELTIQDGADAEAVKHFIATYLQVPEALALSAICDAITLAIKDGEITVETLMLVNQEDDDAPKATEIGRLLRIIYFRHRETSTAALDAEATQ